MGQRSSSFCPREASEIRERHFKAVARRRLSSFISVDVDVYTNSHIHPDSQIATPPYHHPPLILYIEKGL